MEKNKKTLPSFHDPVKRYLAEYRRSRLDGTAMPVVTMKMPLLSDEDWTLIRQFSRQAIQIGLS
ncbi:MAG: hypothetical protein GXO90_10305 [FCB group bacterium]|nr:hypothetical protein [FCB group bacterium]